MSMHTSTDTPIIKDKINGSVSSELLSTSNFTLIGTSVVGQTDGGRLNTIASIWVLVGDGVNEGDLEGFVEDTKGVLVEVGAFDGNIDG